MNTQNIISTPDITGNIGSCETKSTEAMIHGGLLSREYKVVMTNSCTGQIVENYNYTQYSWLSSFGIAILMILGAVIIRSMFKD